MADIFDYLTWRGDISFSNEPLNPVDALIFSTLSYIWYDGIVPETTIEKIPLKEVAERFLEIPGHECMVRVKLDVEFLKAAAKTRRFGETELTFFRNILVREEETQFAALTCILDDGTAVVVFRGTDHNLAGWKEDFNMTFSESVPAQREALRYVNEFAEVVNIPFYLTGHSKGGNLAVYAAAKSCVDIQKRILQVYNHDGPGFTEYMMGDAGYLAMVPKIRTYIPQSSMVGMLLQHEEPYAVIKSRQIDLLQHNPYSWAVSGTDFICVEEVSEHSKKRDTVLKKWFAGMSLEERSAFIDTVYEVLTSGGANQITDLVQLKNVLSYVKTLKTDEKKRQIIAGELTALSQTMKKLQRERQNENEADL